MELLVTIAALIAGSSLSPELWVAVVAVVMLGTSPIRFLVAFVLAAIALVSLRVLLVPGFPPWAVAVSVASLLLWSLLGILIWRWLRKTVSFS